MQITKKGRTIRTREEWAQLISEYQASGLSITGFCQQRSICESAFRRWYKRLSKSSGQLPLRIAEQSVTGKFVEIPLEVKRSPEVRAVVELGHGIVLKVLT